MQLHSFRAAIDRSFPLDVCSNDQGRSAAAAADDTSHRGIY